MASHSSEPVAMTARLAALLQWLLLAAVGVVSVGLVAENVAGAHHRLHVIGVGLLVGIPFIVTAVVALAAVRSHPRVAAFAAATLGLVALGAWIA